MPLFDPSAGFHLAKAGMDRNIRLSDEVCIQEKNRIRANNAGWTALLERQREVLLRERSELLAAGVIMPWKISASQCGWPIWQIVMAVVFISAGFGFTRMSFEPFDLSPKSLLLCSVGIACLCAYATSEFLEKTHHKKIVVGLSIVLFALSVSGLAMLASVRGDLFAHHLQKVAISEEAGSATANDSGLAFYANAAPKMRLFLTLLSLSLELAGGFALHEVRIALKARRVQPSPECLRLQIVEEEIGQTDAHLIVLRNEPEVFEAEFRRNHAIGLLDAASRHASKAYPNWPATLALLAMLGVGSRLYGQSIDLWDALDYSATSKATSYDGSAAYMKNIQAAARIIESLPAGSRVTVAGISDQSFSRPLTLLTGEIPNSPGRLSEFDQIAATRNRLVTRLLRTTSSIKPDYQATDILGCLMAAGIAFGNTPHMHHVLVIHSDMRQSATPLNIENDSTVPVVAALRTVAREQLFADLSGVDVFIYGVHAAGKDVRYWRSLREFWAAYFERCHANLHDFSPTRETPKLGQAQ